MFRLLGFIGVFVIACSIASAAPPANQVTINILANASVDITVASLEPVRSWSFRNAVAGKVGLGNRVSQFHVDEGQVNKIASGEFRGTVDVEKYTYVVDLSQPEIGSVSHTSWLAAHEGILMFADLLPLDLLEAPAGVSVKFVLPSGWSVASSEQRTADGYQVQTPESSVFIVSSSIERDSTTNEDMRVDLVVSGKWPFSTKRALDQTVKIVKKYSKVTGYTLPHAPLIIVAPLPIHSGVTQWKAETRGSTILLLVDPAAHFANWIGQLGVILTHEGFHLWVPNSLKLSGDYDWFFEGFTLYQALLTALDLRLIDFKEYLATLARV